ncbi:transposase [Enterococcus faecalis]|nr:transposase [Enterococcus faecalis]ELT8948095.1 transposase [Enterococcus faecalis]MRJ30699.1 transposase [Enterococcus faecalis]
MEEIRRIFHEHHSRYGTIRITKVLNKKGLHFLILIYPIKYFKQKRKIKFG